MDFKSDLAAILRNRLETAGIRYDDTIDAYGLVSRYCEMMIRRVSPTPRTVHFSHEIHASLGKLLKDTPAEEHGGASDAWTAVFFIRHLLSKGLNVNPFLSKSVNDLTYSDGLLWDFGMHHFHLSRKVEGSGFVERSDYLLFAMIKDTEAFFVDVRPHRDPEGLGWVRQHLLDIVHSNWPELLYRYELRGSKGTRLTDEEKKNLRSLKLNHVTVLGGKAIMPIGGGVMGDGSSAWCRFWASKILHEIDQHQTYFGSQPSELRSTLKEGGVTSTGKMEFRLVELDSLDPSPELIDSMCDDKCLSKDLCHLGFVVVEASTGLPIKVSVEGGPDDDSN